MKNHYKRCNGEGTVNGKKECKNCMKWISKANFAKQRLSCGASDKELSGTHNLSTRTCRTNRKKCKNCDKMITVTIWLGINNQKPACSVFGLSKVNLMP